MATKLGCSLTNKIFMAKIPPMGRPRKYGELPVDVILKIPVTSEQRELIQQATAGEPGGVAAWARALLVAAAERKLRRDRTENDGNS